MYAAWQDSRQGLKCVICFCGVAVVLQALCRLQCLASEYLCEESALLYLTDF